MVKLMIYKGVHMRRINVFTGHFGSGKTEIAINYAIKLAKQGEKVTLVDIDIVNPYFCSRDVKEELQSFGVRLISANPHFSNAELMVVPPEVVSAFNDKSHKVIFDIGGDDMGAVALGQYNRYFKEEPYDMYLVVNNNRPLTSNAEDAEKYLKEIEKASRLKVNYLISNTNLSNETTIEDILRGDEEVSKLSKRLNIPYAFTACRKDMCSELQGRVKGEIFGIDIYMKTPWQK